MSVKSSIAAVAVLWCATIAWADPKADAKALQGTWVPVSAEVGGAKFPDEVIKDMKLTLTDGAYTVEVGKQTDKGTFTLDGSKKPAAMDINGTEGPNKGKTLLAIYEISGDSLKICYDLEGKVRPTEFKTMAKTPTLLVTYKRAKQ